MTDVQDHGSRAPGLLSRRGLLRAGGTVVGGLMLGAGALAADAYTERPPTPAGRVHPSWREPISPGGPAVTLTVATYNLHDYVGRDGREDLERVARVIRSLDADIIGIQELSAWRGREALDRLAQLVDRRPINLPGPTDLAAYRRNTILTRYPVRQVRALDLSYNDLEHRGLLDAEIEVQGQLVRICSTHLGLHHDERADQIGRILDHLLAHPRRLGTVLMGDLNDWLPYHPNLAAIAEHMGPVTDAETFPSGWPLLRLDRIWVDRQGHILSSRVHRDGEAQVASDHCPVVARVRLGAGAP